MQGSEVALWRWLLIILCAVGLVLVFVGQHYNFSGWFGIGIPASYYVNRTIRFMLNDALSLGLIWAIFVNRRFVLFALGLQLFEFLFLLVPYFILKAFYSAYDGPLLSFIHRLTLNPVLLLLLIPAFYYQQLTSSKSRESDKD